MHGVYITLINSFTIFMFFTNLTPLYMYENISTAGIPIIDAPNRLTTMSFGIIYLFVILTSFLLVTFNPVRIYISSRHSKNALASTDGNKNIRMLLHKYKNSYISAKKKLELVQLFIKNNQLDTAKQQLYDLERLMSENIEFVSYTLDSLRYPTTSFNLVNLSECIGVAVSKAHIPSSIKITNAKYLEDVYVFASYDHIVEMFVNLIMNAITAIEVKGIDEGDIQISIINEQDIIAVNIKDNGCGISRENIRKIFEPFFSTNNTSTSNGIGLNYVKNVINAHHGHIHVKSKVNSHTLFQIALPANESFLM